MMARVWYGMERMECTVCWVRYSIGIGIVALDSYSPEGRGGRALYG